MMDRTGRQRRWVKIATVALTALLIGVAIGSRVVGSMFRARLASALHAKLGAELAGGSVLYLPPYTFVMRDVRVTRPDRSGAVVEIVKADGLRLRLAGFPKKGAQAGIDHLTVDRAELRLEPDRPGVALRRVELREQPAHAGQYRCELKIDGGEPLNAEASGLLDTGTHVLQLDSLSVNGRVGGIAAEIPASSRVAAILAGAKLDGTVAISGTGSIPLKDTSSAKLDLTLMFDNLTAWVAPWRRSVRNGRGRVLVRATGKSTADEGRYPRFEATLDHFEADSSSLRVRLVGGKLDVDPSAQDWRLAEVVGSVQMGNTEPLEIEPPEWFSDRTEFGGPVEFTAAASGPFKIPPGASPLATIRHEVLAYPHGCWFRPRKFPMAITQMTGGPIAFRGGVVSIQNVSGLYGHDKLLLRTARLVLEDPAQNISLGDLRTQFKYEEIAGTMIFARPNSPYPGAFGKTVAQLRPEGAFQVGAGSWYATNRPPKSEPWRKLAPDLFIRLTTDGSSFRVTGYQIPLTDIHGDATISPLAVEVSHFDSRTMGGTALARGRIATGAPFFYNGSIQLRDLDLRRLGTALDLKGPVRSRLSGTGYADLTLSGQSKGGTQTPLEALTADGEFQVLHGDFWAVPPVHEVATGVKSTDELGEGDAAGVFHIADQTITLENAAINSPLFGLQGTGTIGFDKTIDLTIVAAPLGDWRDKMAQAGIPLVGDVLGAIQKLFNTAQGALLYQFRVTGTAADPVKALIPAPIITNPLAMLFGQMIRPDQPVRLLDAVRAGYPQSQPARAGRPVTLAPASSSSDAPPTTVAPAHAKGR